MAQPSQVLLKSESIPGHELGDSYFSKYTESLLRSFNDGQIAFVTHKEKAVYGNH